VLAPDFKNERRLSLNLPSFVFLLVIVPTVLLVLRVTRSSVSRVAPVQNEKSRSLKRTSLRAPQTAALLSALRWAQRLFGASAFSLFKCHAKPADWKKSKLFQWLG
jgi:hypothetical protein